MRMNEPSVLYRGVLLVVAATALPPATALAESGAAESWPQWGGVTGDFKVDVAGLAERWDADGPKRLWKRSLGDGYSSIVAVSGTIYTMYRAGDDEVVIAMHADTGETLWEHRYLAKPYDSQTTEFGQGPGATPLIVGDILVTAGFTGLVTGLNRRTGKVKWRRDLVNSLGGGVPYYGYANSPIAYNGNILILVGGARHGVVALAAETGGRMWASAPSDISYASPIMINVDGQDQFVFFSPEKVIGMDPNNGLFLWGSAAANLCRTNCTSAVWGPDNLLWAATKGVGGTRVLKLSQSAGKTDVREIWLDRKVRVYHWNAVRVGDYVHTSIGGSQKFLAVVDVKTGRVAKKLRGFGSTNRIYADGKMIILDDDGTLALAKVLPGDIEIVSKTQLFESVTWTPPTLVGTKLYVRDRRDIVALDLGQEETSTSSSMREKSEHLTSP